MGKISCLCYDSSQENMNPAHFVDPAMSKAIERFVSRLSLPTGGRAQVLDCRFNTYVSPYFQSAEKTHQVIQLYHAQRGIRDHSDAICREGFNVTLFGNKGSGVYLANHSRYSWDWAFPGNPVLICNVIVDPEQIQRYRSEIYAPEWDSEYVIKDPRIIYPKYILHYKIEGCWTAEIRKQIGFVEQGHFGCSVCDHQVIGGIKGVRCDCPLMPVVDSRDLIEK